MRYFVGFAILLGIVGCGSTIRVGNGSSGGDGGTEAEKGNTEVSPEVAASPHFKRCSVACAAPKDGPCAGEDVGACIEKCTTGLDGFNTQCAQCLVENSGYAGLKCEKVGEPGLPVRFDAYREQNAPTPGADCQQHPTGQPPTCETCESLCPCTADKEKCDGFVMAKTTASSCKDACSSASLPPVSSEDSGSHPGDAGVSK